MPETIEELVKQAIAAAQSAGDLPEFEVKELGVERPADTTNGDWSSTVAMRSARLAHMAPAKIAQAIVDNMPANPSVAKVEVAGPGFINFYMSTSANNEVFRAVREKGADWGRSDLGHGLKLNYEFISANPTGPLHVGHGRWAALGDSLCNVFEFTGYHVDSASTTSTTTARRWTCSDAPSRCATCSSRRSCARTAATWMPRTTSCSLTARPTSRTRTTSVPRPTRTWTPSTRRSAATPTAATTSWTSRASSPRPTATSGWTCPWRSAWTSSASAATSPCSPPSRRPATRRAATLTCGSPSARSTRRTSPAPLRSTAPSTPCARTATCTTTDDGALWFKSTAFGDDKDRVLVKSNGEYTYFASDVAYHWNKFQRVDHVIDIWGADHHGYIKRVTNVCDALGYPGKFEVDLGQFVNLLRNGEPVRMSKRKGTMITFQELIDEVGVDATRYTLVSKSSNQTIDFDIEAVKQRDNTNPVYYVQYAHARICSILRKAAGVSEDEALELGMEKVAQKAIGDSADLSLLTDPTEAALARKISEFPDLVAGCARDRAPFRLTHFAEELAGAFHGFYANCQVLPSEGRPVDPEVSRARLVACDAVRINLEVALKLIGVSAPDVM